MHVVWPARDSESQPNDCPTGCSRASKRLGYADHFFSCTQVRCRRLPLRLGVAAVHGMGFSGRIPLPSPPAGIFQSSRESSPAPASTPLPPNLNTFPPLLPSPLH